MRSHFSQKVISHLLFQILPVLLNVTPLWRSLWWIRRLRKLTEGEGGLSGTVVGRSSNHSLCPAHIPALSSRPQHPTTYQPLDFTASEHFKHTTPALTPPPALSPVFCSSPNNTPETWTSSLIPSPLTPQPSSPRPAPFSWMWTNRRQLLSKMLCIFSFDLHKTPMK